MKENINKKRGRPRLPNGEKRLSPISFRPIPSVVEKIRSSAQANGRSITQEIECRLNLSFEVEQ